MESVFTNYINRLCLFDKNKLSIHHVVQREFLTTQAAARLNDEKKKPIDINGIDPLSNVGSNSFDRIFMLNDDTTYIDISGN